MDSIKVCVASGHFLIREGLSSLIAQMPELMLAHCPSTHEALTSVPDATTIGLILLDYETLEMDGSDIKEVMQQYQGAATLLLTHATTPHEAAWLSNTGAKQIVSLADGKDELQQAIDMAMRGRKFYSESVLELLLEKSKTPPADNIQLTATETDIVRQIAEGRTTKEIAQQKNVSFHTVMTHRKNIFRKLKVTNVSELMLHAIKAGWIDGIEYYI